MSDYLGLSVTKDDQSQNDCVKKIRELLAKYETYFAKYKGYSPTEKDQCKELDEMEQFLRDEGADYEYDYDKGKVDKTIRDESVAAIKLYNAEIKKIYPKEWKEDVETDVCRFKLLYALLAYGIVGILGLVLVVRGIHTAFLWPTLSTLVTFNVLLRSVNYGMPYCYCVVGGLAWEGFNFYEGARYQVETDYVNGIALVYRNYQERFDVDHDPQVILTNFYFFQELCGFGFIYGCTSFAFLFFFLLSKCHPAIFAKAAREFFMNANYRFLLVYSLPLPWICFMFYARADLKEGRGAPVTTKDGVKQTELKPGVNIEEGFSIAVALVLLILVIVGILVACIFLVCVYRRFKVLSFYQTWNTLLFEMNPLYRRPPIYNFLFLLKNFLLAIWLASTHNYPNYEVKIGVMVFG